MLAPRKILWSTPLSAVDHCVERIPLTTEDCVCDIGCGDGRILLEWAKRMTSAERQSTAASLLAAARMDEETRENQGMGMEGDDGDHQNQASKSQSHHRYHRQRFPTFVGIDIDPDRIQQANKMKERLWSEGAIAPHMSIIFVCCNALESPEVLAVNKVSVVFLYLIPRGLKQIWPLLEEHRNHHCRKQQQQQQQQAASAKLRVVSYMAKLPCDEPPVGRALCTVHHQKEAAWPLYFYEL